MKFNIDKKSALSIAAVIGVGIVLALLIVFWKGDGAPAQEAGERAEEIAEAKPGEADEHTEQPGLIEMSPEQIQAAGIATAAAGPASIRTELVLPGEVRFNEDRTAHVVPRVAGVAESVSASLGQDVRKGQALAVIASAELADLRSDALAAGKRLELARITYAREKGCGNRRYLPNRTICRPNRHIAKPRSPRMRPARSWTRLAPTWHPARTIAMSCGRRLPGSSSKSISRKAKR